MVRSKTDDIVPSRSGWRLECYRGTQYLAATVVGGGVHSGRQTGHYGDLAVDESPLSQRLRPRAARRGRIPHRVG